MTRQVRHPPLDGLEEGAQSTGALSATNRELMQEIVARKKAENALKESEGRYRALVEQSIVGIYIVEKSRITYANPKLCEIVGHTAEQLRGSDLSRLFVAADFALVRDALRRRKGGDRDPIVFDCRAVHAQGHQIHLSVESKVTTVGSSEIAMGVVRDITPRIRAEEALRASELRFRELTDSHTASLESRVAERTAALEAANLELETFDYSIAHDLRAPLRHINGYSAALLADCAGKLEPQSLDHLRRLHAAGEKLDRMVGDLFRLSTLTRGEIRREQVDVSALAESVVADLRKAHPGRDVKVVVEPSMMAHADRGLLHIALENLLGNAWKFSSDRARARIEVGQEIVDRNQVLFVRDNGAGFDMAYADKLFAPFRRLHKEGEYKGTGIGLATVQRIVRLHAGRIWAEGVVDHGATFHFTLPKTRGAP